MAKCTERGVKALQNKWLKLDERFKKTYERMATGDNWTNAGRRRYKKLLEKSGTLGKQRDAALDAYIAADRLCHPIKPR
jgi:hypothetical protein